MLTLLFRNPAYIGAVRDLKQELLLHGNCTRLDWQDEYARDPELLHRYQTTILPALSVANVRALLRAAMPLPQLSPAEAAALVVKHLDNRTRSRSSRMQNRAGP